MCNAHGIHILLVVQADGGVDPRARLASAHENMPSYHLMHMSSKISELPIPPQ